MKRCQVKLNVLIFYEIVYFFTLYTCSKHLYLAQKLLKVAPNAESCWKAAEHNQDKLTDSSRSLWVTCAAGGFVQALKCYEDASLPVDTSG